MDLVGLIGILIGLGLLMWLAFRGWSVLLLAPLAVLAAAVDVDQDVEGRGVLRRLERLAHDHAAGLAREELVHRLAVDDELSLAGLEEHACHRALAPPGAVVVVADHVCLPYTSRALGCCAVCGCVPAA